MGKEIRNVCRALAAREALGLRRLPTQLPRVRVGLQQVLEPEDCAILLGFSSDGRFLLFYSWWHSRFQVQWKRADDLLACAKILKRQQQRTTYSVVVGASDSGPLSQDWLLHVWQSVDHALVVAIATDRHTALTSTSDSREHFVTVAPSAMAAADRTVESLSFSFSVAVSCQQMRPWQLLPTVVVARQAIHPLVVHMGATVTILLFRSSHHQQPKQDQGTEEDDGAQRPSRIAFAQNAWYYTPDFPVEFQRETRADSGSSAVVVVECIAQQLFDVERFLRSFLDSYASLRTLNFVDYDLQLIRASHCEQMLYMNCVMELESDQVTSVPHTFYFALFFCVHLFLGKHYVIRALKLPRGPQRQRQQTVIRTMSASLAKKCLSDLTARIPADPTPGSWTNEAVLNEQSLSTLHNPQFPVSIYLNQ